MKSSFTLLVLSLLTAMPVMANVIEDETIYVTLTELMELCDAGKETKTQIDSLRASKTNPITELAKRLEQAKKEYSSKASVLSAAAREKEEKSLMKMERDLKDMIEEADREFKEEYMRLTEDLFKELREVIAHWAKEQKVFAVVDAESGRILYRRDSADHTKELVSFANRKHQDKTTVAKAKPAPAAAPKGAGASAGARAA